MVTVITVVFNGAATLEATIQSVLRQHYRGVEYIIIDGGSRDGTIDIIKKYESSITRWKSEADNGIYDAMNKGIDMANGEWINFMNSGDLFASPNALQMFDDPAHLPAGDILYGDAIIKYPDFTTLWRTTPLPEMWKRSPFCHQAAFVRANVMKKYKFDLSYRISSDFDFFYRAFLDGKEFAYLHRTICIYDLIDGMSERNRYASLIEQRRSVLSLDFSVWKWIYFTGRIVSQKTVALIKKMIGKKATQWITRSLKA